MSPIVDRPSSTGKSTPLTHLEPRRGDHTAGPAGIMGAWPFRQANRAGRPGSGLVRRLSTPLRFLLGFIIIGAQRGGTTSLYNYLVSHPRVAAAARKEIHYFDKNFAKGASWYRAHFPVRVPGGGPDRALITGESSPYYLFHPLVAERAAALLPQVKLIVLLRNPVDRAESHYYHERRVGVEHLGLEQALDCESERLRGQAERIRSEANYNSDAFQDFSYQARGLYAGQLETWFRFFPREQFFIESSETFFSDPAAVFSRVLAFLNLPQWLPAQFPRYNEGQYPPMKSETRARLREYFAPYNRRLYELLGTEFGWDG